jgi:hypothetical protein
VLSAVVDLMGQVFAFGEKSGIERQHLDMVMQTMFSHPGLQEYAARMREQRYDDDGFDLLGGLKDLQLILDPVDAGAAFMAALRDPAHPAETTTRGNTAGTQRRRVSYSRSVGCRTTLLVSCRLSARSWNRSRKTMRGGSKSRRHASSSACSGCSGRRSLRIACSWNAETRTVGGGWLRVRCGS